MRKHKKPGRKRLIARCKSCGEIIRIDGRRLPNCSHDHCPTCSFLDDDEEMNELFDEEVEETLYHKTPIFA